MGRMPTRVGVIPGAGLVARYGNVVIFLVGDSPSTDRILGTAEAADTAHDPGMAIAQRLAATVFTGSAQPPAFGVVAPTAGGLLILLRGPVTAAVDGPEGSRKLSGERAMTWADEIVGHPVRRLTLAADGASGEIPHTDLRGGVVPGRGFVLHAPVSGLSAPRTADPAPKAAAAHEPVARERTPDHRPAAGPADRPASGPIPAPAQHASKPASPPPDHGSRPAAALPEHGSRPAAAPLEQGSKPAAALPEHGSKPAPAAPEHASRPIPAPTERASGPAAAPSSPVSPPGSEPNLDVTRRVSAPPPSGTRFSTPTPGSGAEPASAQQVSPSGPDSKPGPAYPRNAPTAPAQGQRPGAPRAEHPAQAPRAAGPDLSKRPAAGSKPDSGRENRPDPEQQPPTAAYSPEPEGAETRVPSGPPSTSTLAGPGAALTSTEGETYPLDRPYVIGRDPMIDEAVRRAVASPIVIARDRHVSRVHARVFIEKGQVFVRDAGTPGGTFVAAPGATEWIRVGQQPTELKAGWSLRIGERILTYRSSHP
ncbi:FHA domain-containing protein [Nocardia tengchongensis]|uniref:FHA domain-containing protein n=1 Tax=Nocardia tengchongensis TaxID=2055889 RepID=UPI0036BBAD40